LYSTICILRLYSEYTLFLPSLQMVLLQLSYIDIILIKIIIQRNSFALQAPCNIFQTESSLKEDNMALQKKINSFQFFYVLIFVFSYFRNFVFCDIYRIKQLNNNWIQFDSTRFNLILLNLIINNGNGGRWDSNPVDCVMLKIKSVVYPNEFSKKKIYPCFTAPTNAIIYIVTWLLCHE
jgi:hypothetical protein